MTRIATIMAMAATIGMAGSPPYAPRSVAQIGPSGFDWSTTFDREPTPAEPQHPPVAPETEVIGPGDWPQPTEPIETDLRPDPPQQERPAAETPQRFERRRNAPLVAMYAEDKPQLLILGHFDGTCLPCSQARTAALWLSAEVPAWSAGPDEWCDFRIVDLDTREGQEIDASLGKGNRTITEIAGHEQTGRWEALTPVLVARFPDRDPVVTVGWHGGKPKTSDAAWYLTGLIGFGRDNPERWEATRNSPFDPVGIALSEWVQDNGQVRAKGWGATVPAGKLIDMAFGTGRREIAAGVFLNIPENFRPEWRPGNRPTIGFRNAPFIEYKLGWIPRKKALSHIEIAEDFSRLTIHAEGYKAAFPINIDWSRGE